ncbi:MAG: zinc-dependent alcohol dehydrogenase family protein [Pseudomonadota bacterium]|nr:zinc-dependent alcohol dehydrogenase family protein [Pseudomonadota bacterium]
MRAMVLERPGSPLLLRQLPWPVPGAGQVRLRVRACAVCRTDLHVVDGELPDPALPLVPGHEVVGVVDAVGADVVAPAVGERVGVGWLGHTCGNCRFCLSDRENLCVQARFTGYQLPGGYAEAMVADARACLPLPAAYPDPSAAPLLCAGTIGYRAYRMAGDAERIGLYGFGAAAHILTQLAVWQGRAVFAFVRPGDAGAEAFARALGATWAGPSTAPPPAPLDAALIFAPVGALVPAALAAVDRGGVVVCAGIHMSDVPSFPYRLLWHERVVRSVANLTRRDGVEFLALAPQVPVRTTVQVYPLEAANEALADLRAGRVTGAAVLVP